MGLFRVNASGLVRVGLAMASLLAPMGSVAGNLPEQREQFRQAYAQVQAGDVEAVRPVLASLRTYPLYPWLEYELLVRQVDKTPDDLLRAFVENHPNSVMGDSLYVRWAQRLASTRDWSALLRYIPDTSHLTATRCYRAEALLVLGQTQTGLAQGKALWDGADKELPSDCNGLLAALRQHQALSVDDHWQRIRALMGNNRVGAARSLAAYLPEADAKLVELWGELRANPANKIPDVLAMPETAHLRAMVADGLMELADDGKLANALALWEKAQQAFTFTPAEKGEVESKFGRWEAWKHDPNALSRLKAVAPEHRSVEGNVWLARMAMRSEQWKSVLEAATALEKAEAVQDDRDTWVYWKARALEGLGRKAEADALYREQAGDATFYGFLSADRLRKDYAHLDAVAPDRSQRTRGLQKLAVVQRWQEWMALGDRSQARKEWFRALQDMDREGVLAAARLATVQGDANLAIWTVSRTKDWNSVDLRFPLLYEQIVMEQARSQGIRPEWILGIMRRESAFDAGAESSAQALGLMQLMPATARDVGRQLGMQVAAKEDILQPATNVQLGSAYLRSMLRRFSGNYAQATAAYNAGPGRIPKWAPERTLQADQWVESIPFDETRKYVKAVMAYTTVYDHKLNQAKSDRLSVHLHPINPKQAD